MIKKRIKKKQKTNKLTVLPPLYSNIMILEGEIKDAKMSSFSSDFQTLIKHLFPLYFLYELLISLWSQIEVLYNILRKCFQDYQNIKT